MNSEWKEFLGNAGAEFNGAGISHFGNPKRELSVALSGTVFADLSHYGLVSVFGEDAESFLQGQFTNDIRMVDEQHSQLSGYCSAKGRLLAVFRIFRSGDSYYLCLPDDMVDAVIKRLRMYILRARVTVNNACDSFIHIGVSGADAERDLAEYAGPLPQQVDHTVQQDQQVVVRVAGAHPSFEIFTDLERAKALWDRLNVRSAPVGSDAWQFLDIQAGVPMIYPTTTELFIPQMTNLQLVGGVSFKKGCYPGQEIVARTQYLGKLKRHMYKVRIAGDARPVPGQELFAGNDTEQSAGNVVSSAPHPEGGYAALVVLKSAIADAGAELRLGAVDGQPVTLEQLPYSLQNEE